MLLLNLKNSITKGTVVSYLEIQKNIIKKSQNDGKIIQIILKNPSQLLMIAFLPKPVHAIFLYFTKINPLKVIKNVFKFT